MREDPLIGLKKTDPLLAKTVDSILAGPLTHVNNHIDPIKGASSLQKQERYKILAERDINRSKLNK